MQDIEIISAMCSRCAYPVNLTEYVLIALHIIKCSFILFMKRYGDMFYAAV